VPLVGIEALEHVLVPRPRRRAVELDQVVVVQENQPTEAQVAGQAGRLRCDALLQVAVRADAVDPVVDDVVTRPVELVGESALGDGHPDGISKSLTEWSRCGVDARRQAVLGVTRGA
jgi:hypothetical protein